MSVMCEILLTLDCTVRACAKYHRQDLGPQRGGPRAWHAQAQLRSIISSKRTSTDPARDLEKTCFFEITREVDLKLQTKLSMITV